MSKVTTNKDLITKYKKLITKYVKLFGYEYVLENYIGESALLELPMKSFIVLEDGDLSSLLNLSNTLPEATIVSIVAKLDSIVEEDVKIIEKEIKEVKKSKLAMDKLARDKREAKLALSKTHTKPNNNSINRAIKLWDNLLDDYLSHLSNSFVKLNDTDSEEVSNTKLNSNIRILRTAYKVSPVIEDKLHDIYSVLTSDAPTFYKVRPGTNSYSGLTKLLDHVTYAKIALNKDIVLPANNISIVPLDLYIGGGRTLFDITNVNKLLPRNGDVKLELISVSGVAKLLITNELTMTITIPKDDILLSLEPNSYKHPEF